MKFLVDENLPPRLAAWLNERGHDAVHVQDIALLGTTDRRIREAASKDQRVIVTKDSDFDAPGEGTRVLKLSIGNSSTPALLAWLDQSLFIAVARFNNGESFVEID